jgi:hypothetical protein
LETEGRGIGGKKEKNGEIERKREPERERDRERERQRESKKCNSHSQTHEGSEARSRVSPGSEVRLNSCSDGK